MLIEFGQVKPQLLILLIYPVGILFARIITVSFISNPLYYLFLFFISHFLALIPLAYYKVSTVIHDNNRKKTTELINKERTDESFITNVSEESKNKNNPIQLLKGKIENTKIKHKALLILLVGFFYFFTYFFFYYFNYITKTDFYGNISMVTEVFYFSVFNWILLGNKIYSHHLFSMILITISIVSLYIILLIQYIEDNKNGHFKIWNNIFFPTILNFIAYCLYCYCLIKAKYIMEKYFIFSYELIVFLGLIGIGLLIIIEPITFLISCRKESIICDTKNNHIAGIITGLSNINGKIDIFYSLGLFFTLFMTCLGLWLTVKELTPCHFLTSDSIITFELNILLDCLSVEKKLLRNILFYVFSIIIIFGCLVYNEIIIINFCKLNYNTRMEIIKRQSKDIKDNNYELPEYDSENNFETLTTVNTLDQCLTFNAYNNISDYSNI